MDAIGIKKALNIVEQSKHRETAKEVLCRVWNEYEFSLYFETKNDVKNLLPYE